MGSLGSVEGGVPEVLLDLGTLADLGGGMRVLSGGGVGDLPEEEELPAVEVEGEFPLLSLLLSLLLEFVVVVVPDDLWPFFTTFLIFFPAKVMLDLACQKKRVLLDSY